MTPASEMPPVEDAGRRSGPTRPFIPGREAGPAPSPEPRTGLPRPFRAGSAARDLKGAVQTEGGTADSIGSDLSDGVSEGANEALLLRPTPIDSDDDLLLPGAGAGQELPPESDFAPLASWDPLADVGWRAIPPEAELDIEAETLALLGADARIPREPDGDTNGLAGEKAASEGEGAASEEDELASKLEAIAAAIRRGKITDLLAENPQDALTALVAGFYMGGVGRRGGSGS